MHRKLLYCLSLFFFVSASPLQAQETKPPASLTKAARSKTKKASKATERSPAEREAQIATELQASLQAYNQKQYASALAYCERALQLAPNETRILRLCLQLNIDNKKFNEALGLLEQLYQQRPNERELPENCFVHATLLTRLERWPEAIAAYQRCSFESKELRAAMLGNLAELHMIQVQIPEAIQAYALALEVNPDNPHALFGATVALARAGLWEEAEQRFLQGVTVDPELNFLNDAFFVPEGEIHYHKAVFAALSRQTELALFELKNYLKHEQRPAYKAQAEAMKAALTARLDRSERADLSFLPVLLDNVSSLSLDSSGRYLAIAREKKGSNPGSLWLIDLQEKSARQRLLGLNSAQLAFKRASTELYVLDLQKRYILDAKTPDDSYYFYDNNGKQLFLSLNADGSQIILADPEKGLSLTDFLESERLESAPEPLQHCSSPTVAAISVSQNLKHCAFIDSQSLHFLDLKGPEAVKRYPAFFSPLLKIATSSSSSIRSILATDPQSRYFALAALGGSLIFDTQGKALRYLGSHGQNTYALNFDPSGEKLLVLSGTELRIWSLTRLFENQKALTEPLTIYQNLPSARNRLHTAQR